MRSCSRLEFTMASKSYGPSKFSYSIQFEETIPKLPEDTPQHIVDLFAKAEAQLEIKDKEDRVIMEIGETRVVDLTLQYRN